MSDHTDLIAELDEGCNDGGDLPSLLGRARATIEALVKERDELAAVIERVQKARADHPSCDAHPDADVVKCGWKSAVLDIDTAIDAAPADALREHDAALLQDFANRLYQDSLAPWPAVERALERARQVREGEA